MSISLIGRVGAAALLALSTLSTGAVAHQTTGDPFPHVHGGQQRTIKGEIYKPTIWVDPDGCEHWVMDDGWEGFMTPKLDRQGRPTCRGAVQQQSACGVMSSDTLFATGSAKLSYKAQSYIKHFFATNPAAGYVIVGHTDSRGSDAYNMNLSMRRAHAVAGVARYAGANIVDVKGAGERHPIAPNNTKYGMAKNRRVEIMCAGGGGGYSSGGY